MLPRLLDIILTSEATDVAREVPNPKCAWTARAIRKENGRGKGNSLKGWGGILEGALTKIFGEEEWEMTAVPKRKTTKVTEAQLPRCCLKQGTNGTCD